MGEIPAARLARPTQPGGRAGQTQAAHSASTSPTPSPIRQTSEPPHPPPRLPIPIRLASGQTNHPETLTNRFGPPAQSYGGGNGDCSLSPSSSGWPRAKLTTPKHSPIDSGPFQGVVGGLVPLLRGVGGRIPPTKRSLNPNNDRPTKAALPRRPQTRPTPLPSLSTPHTPASEGGTNQPAARQRDHPPLPLTPTPKPTPNHPAPPPLPHPNMSTLIGPAER